MWKSSTKRTILGLVLALLATIVAVILTVILMYKPNKKSSSSSSNNQSKNKTQSPSFSPSVSVAPSLRPSGAPSFSPSDFPSSAPSVFPTTVPSSPPSGYPSVSPSATPTLRPTSINFVLKQHWEREYFWQETYEEAKWCAECTTCPFLSDSDRGDKICTDLDKNDPSCNENDQLWVQGCGPGKGNAVFNLDQYDTYDVLRIARTDLCMTRARDRFVYLSKCVANNNDQKWKKISFDKPFDLRGPEPFKGLCMTNRHHPKAAEIYYMNDCREVYIYNTALWDAVPI